LSLKNLTGSLFVVAALVLGSSAWPEEINIYFKTSPLLEHIRPLADPATLSLLITGADGKPFAQGWVDITLEAPKSGRFFSTDFPLVEGKRLTEMRLPLRGGRTEWKYLFPIRGEYRLTVRVMTVDGRHGHKTFPVSIREQSYKWYLLGAFTLALFAFGVIAGRVFTRASPAVTHKAMVSLLLLVLWLSSKNALTAEEPLQEKYFGWLEVGPASVGTPTRVSWRLQGDDSASRTAALLTLTISHLETRKTVFSVERLSVAGEFSMRFQFTDGAEYRVAATAFVPGRGVVRTEQHVSVTVAEPPARAVLPAIGFFLAVIAGGLGVGRWSRRAAPSASRQSLVAAKISSRTRR
jgi:hypothetical protein